MRLLLVVLLLCLAGCGSPGGFVELTALEYQRGEQVVESAWTPTRPGDPIAAQADLPVWFRCTPPVIQAPDPAVRLSWGLFVERAFVGSREVTLRGDPLIIPLIEPGVPVMVRIGGQVLGFTPHIVAGSQRELWADAVRDESPAAVIGGAVLVAGALLLLAGLRRGGARSYRGLGLFFASLGVILLVNLRHWIMLMPINPHVLMNAHHLATLLYPVGFAGFVLEVFGEGRWKLVRRGLVAYAVYVALAVVLHFARIVDFRQARILVGLFITLFCGHAIVRAAVRAWHGDGVGKAFLVGIALLLGFGLWDILSGTNGVQLVPFGILGFAVCVVIVLERQFVRAHGDLQRSALHLKEQVDALEKRNIEIRALNQELRHQIAERSRQMVQSLQSSDAIVASSRALQPGDVVGDRYCIVRPLGKGGMGAVFEVLRLTDERRFALKMMAGVVSPRAAARFAREAEIAARVVDEHLVPVVDIGGADTGELYFVMELVDGRSLEEARERWGDVLWARGILLQVAKGLCALHSAGVVHRDLKPANVLLSCASDGGSLARIADFGISHLETEQLDASSSLPEVPREVDVLGVAHADTLVLQAERNTAVATLAASEAPRKSGSVGGASAVSSGPLTATGVIMGTPAYMAPEVIRGARAARPASDMFAFGLIAFELLTGRSAYDVPAARLAVAGGPLPPLPAWPASVPAEVARLVTTCLELLPDARPTSREAVEVFGASP